MPKSGTRSLASSCQVENFGLVYVAVLIRNNSVSRQLLANFFFLSKSL